MVVEHQELYVLRNLSTGKLILSYNPSSQTRKAIFANERTARNAREYIKRWLDAEVAIEKIS
jgi:hypothetical protein